MIDMPLHGEEVASEESDAVPAQRLLVIDDSKEARDFLEEFLGHYGYVVLTACDGEEGLHRALNEDPDLILVDMRMPLMTGLEVIEALGREGRDIPVIFTTAHGSEDLAVQAFRLGVVDYVPKPYEPHIILEAVQRALELVQRRRQPERQIEQLQHSLQRQIQELNALNAIGRSFISLLDVGQVSERIVEAATYMTRAEEASLTLLDPSTGALFLRAVKTVEETRAHSLLMRADDALVSRVFESGRPILLDGDGIKEIDSTRLENALLMVPLQVAQLGVVGVLTVANKIQDVAFFERDLHKLTSLASFAALAVKNAALMTDLREEKIRLETVLHELGQGVLVMDEQRHVVVCNRVARRAFGLADDHVLGQPLGDVIQNRELLDLLRRCWESEAPQQSEVTLNDLRTLSAWATIIPGFGCAVLFYDITPLKELDRVKSTYISSFSHDLRTPLTTAHGYLDLLARVGPLTEQQQDIYTRARRGLTRINELVSGLTDSSGIDLDFSLETVITALELHIAEAVAELRPQADAKEQSLKVHLPENLSLIRGDPSRLRQVLCNLLDNAVKYTPRRGHIAVDVSEGEDHVTVRVIDDGIGIPVIDQRYVFDQHFRVDRPEVLEIPGAGLGLSMVKSIVERHGGRVWLESALGEGSTFTFVLPKS